MANKILIVDDDREFLQFAQTVLEGAGFLVCPAGTGKAALDWLDEPAPPSLIILDINLPKEQVSGIELCRKLKRDPHSRRVPIIILSAQTDNQARLDATLADSDLILSKPIKPEELRAAVKSVLARPLNLKKGVLARGPLELDPETRRVTYNLKTIKGFSESLFGLLYLLTEWHPKTLTRRYILSALGMQAQRDREVDVIVSRLRKKLLSELRAGIVLTVPGKGYRLELGGSLQTVGNVAAEAKKL